MIVLENDLERKKIKYVSCNGLKWDIFVCNYNMYFCIGGDIQCKKFSDWLTKNVNN